METWHLCWLTEEEDANVKEEQEEIVANDVQETAVSLQTTMPSPKPIHTHPNPKPACSSLHSCRQVKRKAATAIYSAVNDKDNEDYKGDIAEDYKEDYQLVIKDCSNSGIQGPKMKKARKSPHQDMFEKNGRQCFNCS